MSSHRTACVSDRHEVTCGLDPPVMPPHVSHNADVECLQQRPRRLQTTSGIVVAGNDHGCHSWLSAAQPHKRIVEELLRFSGRVLTVEHVTGDYERIHIPLYDDLFEPLKNFTVLVLARKPAQRLTDVPISRVERYESLPSFSGVQAKVFELVSELRELTTIRLNSSVQQTHEVNSVQE